MIDIETFELELTDPLVSASETIGTRKGCIVRYGDGIGEATPLPPWTEPFDETIEVLERFVEEPRPIGAMLDTLTECPAARHGLSTAILDHHATSRDQPLYRYLGGTTTVSSIPLNATLDDPDPTTIEHEAQQVAEEGYQAAKLKVGRHDIEQDIERIHALDRGLTQSVDRRLDANGVWSRETTLAVASSIDDIQLAYLEQPTPGIDQDLITDLTARGVPVAYDEALHSEGVNAVLCSTAAAIVIKPMAMGGPDTARATAMAARGCGITPVISDLVTGAVARTTAAHVVASLPTAVPAGLDTGARLGRDVIETPPAVVNGSFQLPEGAGLGIAEVHLDHAG